MLIGMHPLRAFSIGCGTETVKSELIKICLGNYHRAERGEQHLDESLTS
jgi:hypothetical protein